ncbi:hypothetical protein ILYODFUR_012220 [Ilyodon furcidens]|uniref:Uncharacterized protein n=1 Tax=Ilyodon furcidens TaxID=33524 RepID=A0ABV0TI03_9TELE
MFCYQLQGHTWNAIKNYLNYTRKINATFCLNKPGKLTEKVILRQKSEPSAVRAGSSSTRGQHRMEHQLILHLRGI